MERVDALLPGRESGAQVGDAEFLGLGLVLGLILECEIVGGG
jgi:hypothetical protein